MSYRYAVRVSLLICNTQVIYILKECYTGTSLGVQWLGLWTLNGGEPGSIPSQETRSHIQQLRVWMQQLKILHAAMKIEHLMCCN